MKSNDLLKEKLIEQLLERAPAIEKTVLDDLFKLIDQLDTKGGTFTNGSLSSGDLLEMQDAIGNALKKSGYVQQADLFIQDLGKLTINSTIILEGQGFSFPKLALSDLEKKWKVLTSESLLSSGIKEEFEIPILRLLDESISYGNSVNASKQLLQDFVSGGGDKTGKLQSYLTVTARDSIGQLQGQQMQSVANAVGYAGITYTGGLLKDSRGQCYHWVHDLKGFIPKEKLEAEIKLAYKNSDKKLTEDGHRWSGMMPNTTVDNFMIKRGGYGCLHTAYPKRKKP